MQFQDLPDIQEVTKPIQLNPAEFTVKPSGEIKITGNPSPELVQQILVSSDYQQQQNRQYEASLKSQQQRTDMMIVGFLGATFLIVVACLFLSFSQNRNTENNHGQFITRDHCK